jgi:hypothetical protein
VCAVLLDLVTPLYGFDSHSTSLTACFISSFSDEYPKLFAEMFGFIIATVQLEMPFTLIRSIVVSTTLTKYVLYVYCTVCSMEYGALRMERYVWSIAYQYIK